MDMKLITIQELSELLKVKPKTLYQWAELRQIPFLKLNGALRFDLDDIESWIASCKKGNGSGYNQITKTVTSSPTKGGN
jgi:excisionase family DNA binding protein